MMVEHDVISHLIGIENEAASLLFDAQLEADSRIAAAREKIDGEYKVAFEKLIAEQELRFSEAVALYGTQHDTDFTNFKKELEAWPQDKKSFNDLLDSLLFAKPGK